MHRSLSARASFAFVLLAVSIAFAQNLSPSALYQKALAALEGAQSRDVLTGRELMRRSADGGYIPAQIAMGYIEENGLISPANVEAAGQWYRKAATQNDALASWLLGRLYLTGVLSTRADAEPWLRKSAEAGEPFGEYLLGLYLLERNEREAPPWFAKAAKQGLPQAQLRYARALREGKGIERDLTEAYVWALLANEAGLDATTLINELEGQIGTTQTNAAKARAAELRPKVQRSVNAHGCTGWEGENDEIPNAPPLLTQRYCH